MNRQPPGPGLSGQPAGGPGAAQPWSALTVCWAKLESHGGDRYHPLLYHMIDVAEVARALWATVLAPVTRDRVAAALGVPVIEAGQGIAWWAGLHDLGKASPVFQYRPGVPAPLVCRLEAAGLARYRGRPPAVMPHGTMTDLVLPDLLRQELGYSRIVAEAVAGTIGGHHGMFATASAQRDRAQAGGTSWADWRRRLVHTFADLMEIPTHPPTAPFTSELIAWLAGFVSVADWLGSDQECFPFAAPDPARPPTLPPAAYLSEARARAAHVLARRGWQYWPADDEPRAFAALFPHIPNLAPNPMQRLTVDLGDRLAVPALVVIEAPMGEGKTEAALALVDAWSAKLKRPGAYIALPTQATSNQMFTRVKAFVGSRYPDDLVNIQLLHGHAALAAEFTGLPAGVDFLATPSGIDPGRDEATVLAAEWFTYRKRGLLAPFGVGTIDQALLAVLQTRHWFVRLFGLAGRVVVLDEVHAYDAYMSVLLERLLTWLAALGSPVVLLSATLPADRRHRLLAAYGAGLGQPAPTIPAAPYPRVSWLSVGDAGARDVAISARATKTAAYQWIANPDRDQAAAGSLAARLHTALADGGCVAIICNTVDRAQAIYTALRPHFPGLADDGEPELDLLHARFLYHGREAREQRARRRFGKPAADGSVRRPHRAILVATQVIEQSLDLDFDLMLSDLAPIDLLLQRLGRLHRHPRPDRPAALRAPALWLFQPAIAAGGDQTIADAGSDHVYDKHLLLRSWLALTGKAGGPVLRIPSDIEHLIYTVYDDETENHHLRQALDPSLDRVWDDTWSNLQQRLTHDRELARPLLVRSPVSEESLFDMRNQELAEDNPEVHPTLQALTRLGERTVPVICLPESEAASLRRSEAPTADRAKELLRHSVTIGRKGVVEAILAHATVPSGWAKSALLRHHRLLGLNTDGGCDVGAYRIAVNSALGITMHRLGTEGPNAELQPD